MENAKEEVKKKFISACQKYKFGFVTNYRKIEGFGEVFDENYAVHPLENIASKVNEFWHECDLAFAADKIFESSNEDRRSKVRLYDLPADFYEKLWLSCHGKEEKKCFWETFAHYITIYEPTDHLSVLNNNEYINQLIENYYIHNSRRAGHNDMLVKTTEFFKDKQYTLTQDNLALICKNSKYRLRELTCQKVLKDFVEQCMPNSVESFKQYWKKIDIELVQDEFLTEGLAPYFAFNKIELYNFVSNKNTDFFDRRLKSLTAFLNKTETQKVLNVNRCILDGIQEGQQHYRFFFINNPNNKLDLKDITKELVIGTISMDSEPNLKLFRTLLNYSILKQSAVGNDSVHRVDKRTKI